MLNGTDCTVRDLVFIVCMKREGVTALAFIIPVKDLFII